MAIKFIGYRVRGGQERGTTADQVLVKAEFLAADLGEVAALVAGLRSYGARPEKASGAEAPKPSAPPAPEPSATVAKIDDTRKKANGKKEAAPAKPEPPAPPESDPDLEEDEDEEGDGAEDEPEEAKPAEAAPPGPRPKAKITPAMVESERFTDVVVGLHKQGFTAKEIVGICGKVREKVPAVQKVQPEELAKRVDRVFEIEGLA